MSLGFGARNSIEFGPIKDGVQTSPEEVFQNVVSSSPKLVVVIVLAVITAPAANVISNPMAECVCP